RHVVPSLGQEAADHGADGSRTDDPDPHADVLLRRIGERQAPRSISSPMARLTCPRWSAGFAGATRGKPRKEPSRPSDLPGSPSDLTSRSPSRSAMRYWCSAPSAGFAGATCFLGGGSEGGRSPPPSY